MSAALRFPVEYTGDEGADMFRDISEVVSENILQHDPVFHTPELLNAEIHGTGYLTGAAAEMLSVAVSDRRNGGSAVEFEDDMMEVIRLAYLAIMNERRSDAAEVFAGIIPPFGQGGEARVSSLELRDPNVPTVVLLKLAH